MSVVRQATWEWLLIERVRYLRRHRHTSKRKISGRETLRHGDDVRDDLPVVDGEPLPCPAQARHDLVAYEEDAVLITKSSQAGEIAERG